MVVPFRDAYLRRLFRSEEKLMKMYEELDPNDADYTKKAEALARLHKELADDYKNFGELEIEEARVNYERSSAKIGHIVNIASLGSNIGVTLGMFFAGQYFKYRNFRIASKFEEEDAYRTMSDRSVVQDALREPDIKFWQFWKR